MSLNQLHLSRLILNPRSRAARRDLANPYDLHRTLARAFAPDKESAPERFLWRLEVTANWQQPQLLVQSQTEGNWEPLRDQPYYLQEEVQEKRLALEQWLEPEGSYRFRLHANPTVTRGGKRWGLCNESEQLAWLARQGQRHGFTLLQALVSGSAMQQGRKGNCCLSVLTATFEGYLRVSDTQALQAALQGGIGPAKSLGCGLLSLGRV
ncbi:type I-E CRISPR-associated protein Cas6/Cse3/CasE [Aeromonas enteropelogenes]|uniref:type I-E CRISPR-associated protein Cas6/Cse3/CasE n=1 Tax=Aeromonas enteropelogenes TaxID=29489 RepID=UPI003B9F8AD3